jgi:hypothetical protein
MRKLGAGKMCLVYSEYDYDQPAQEADLQSALAEYMSEHGSRYATLFYCPKSKAAFIEGHCGNQLLLHMKPPAK